jgi:hypothetical protein
VENKVFCPFKASFVTNYFCMPDCALFGKEKCLIAEYLEKQINPFGNLISLGELPEPKKEANNE